MVKTNLLPKKRKHAQDVSFTNDVKRVKQVSYTYGTNSALEGDVKGSDGHLPLFRSWKVSLCLVVPL